MKMMIIGDVHFGIRNNSTTYLDYQKKWFEEELIPNIQKNNIELLIFLGDVFDSRVSINPLVLNTVRTLFKKLTNIVDVRTILGNHDILFRNSKSVHSLTILEDQGVIVYDNPTEIKINNKKMLFLPWVVNDEKDDVTRLLVSNTYDYCFGHLEINSFEKVKGVVETEGLPVDIFSNCQHVYSGHFHLRRQHANITYTGTPYELTWNDYDDQKGVYVVDLDKNEETFIPTTNTPKHVKINSKVHTLDDITSEKINNNIVKISLHETMKEDEKIKYIEKINSLNPISSYVEDDTNFTFDTEETIETDIKDTMGFMNDFVNIVELPENLNKKKLLEYLNELHDKVI